MKVCVVGLGYVGLPTAIALDRAGHDVYGYDIDEDTVASLSRGESRIRDGYVDMHLNTTNVTFETGIQSCDAYIICVPTPIDERFDPDFRPLIAALETVGAAMPSDALVVVESTVNPGVCEETVVPLLSRSRKTYYLAHCPERINPGDGTWTVENIPRVIGGISEDDTILAAKLYDSFIQAPVTRLRSIREAEATKILENTFRDVNIAFVNEMAMSFDKLGIDIVDVIGGASTKPFGFMPFYPGAGVGGHCIAVDPYYMIERGRRSGFDHEFLRLARKINEGMPRFVAGLVVEELNRAGHPLAGTRVALLGLAYKPDVADDRESPAYPLLAELLSGGCHVRVYDPFVTCSASVPSLEQALDGAVAAAIVTAHSEFVADEDKIAECGIIIDGRNCLNRDALVARGVVYRGIGR